MTAFFILGCAAAVVLLAVIVYGEVTARRHRKEPPRGSPDPFIAAAELGIPYPAAGEKSPRVSFGPASLSDDDVLLDDALPEVLHGEKPEAGETHDVAWLKERMRVLEGEGKSVVDALTVVVTELDAEKSLDYIVDLCAGAQYDSVDLAKALAANQYTVVDIAEAFWQHYHPAAQDWVATLWPVAEGTSASENMRSVVEAIEVAEEAQWDDGDTGDTDPADLIQPFLAVGCTLANIVTLLYEKTDRRFGAIVKEIPDTVLPTIADVAALARSSGIGADSGDECGDLVEELDYTLVSLVAFYASYGTSAATLIDLLAGQDMTDDLDDLLTALVTRYPAADVLQAVDSETDRPTAAIADAALEGGAIAWDDVITFLRDRVGDDPAGFEEELIEEDVTFERRIQILHALLQPQPAVPPSSV